MPMAEANVNGKMGILQPVIQLSKAGMSVLLLGVIVWQMERSDRYLRDSLQVQVKTAEVIEKNTAVMHGNTIVMQEFSRIVHDKL